MTELDLDAIKHELVINPPEWIEGWYPWPTAIESLVAEVVRLRGVIGDVWALAESLDSVAPDRDERQFSINDLAAALGEGDTR
jgi:hypothetical protein